MNNPLWLEIVKVVVSIMATIVIPYAIYRITQNATNAYKERESIQNK
jgi:hypothetical protein